MNSKAPDHSSHSPAPMALKTHALLIIMTLIYGAFFPILKLFTQSVSEMEVAAMRVLGFGLVIILAGWGWNVWRRLPIFHPNFKRDWPLFLGVAFFGVFWIQTFAAVAMEYTTAFHATLCMATIPLQTMVLNAVLGYERFTPLRLLGVLLGSAGIFWLVSAQVMHQGETLSLSRDNPLVGDVVVLLNAFFFSLYNIWVKRLVKTYAPIYILSWNFLQAALIMLGLLLLFPTLPGLGLEVPSIEQTLTTFLNLQGMEWFYWVYVVVAAGFFGYLVHHKSLKKTSANNVAAYTLLQPVIAAVLGATLLGEKFTLQMGLAGALTLSGLVVATIISPMVRKHREALSQEPCDEDGL